MMVDQELESELERQVADRYRRQGYEVITEPPPKSLPFDLGFYRPDMLVNLPNGEHYLVEVKSPGGYLNVERLRDIARTVAEHQGWRFFVVADPDRLPDGNGAERWEPLTLPQIRSRLERVDNLIGLEEEEAAFLTLWSLLEALLRRRAEDVQLPVERLEASSLVNHLYSQGELSMQQYDAIKELVSVRNAAAHGFAAPELPVSLPKLRALVGELAEEWWP